jgi:hypothetical protein
MVLSNPLYSALALSAIATEVLDLANQALLLRSNVGVT